jgi:hypothetical protein
MLKNAANAGKASAPGLLDREWYCERYADLVAAGLDPLQHYRSLGWREGRWPSPCFDRDWYRAQATEFGEVEGDPLLHYARHGEAQGRRPIAWFDPVWYRQAHAVPDRMLALAHYLRHRCSGSVNPRPDFDARFYLDSNPDVAAAGRDPFEHYQISGRHEGRLPQPEIEIVRGSGLMDARYYLLNAADVLDARIDPLVHFCTEGWRENRWPNPYFDPGWYIRTYGQQRMGPLTHYLLEGETAGYRPSPYFHPAWYRNTYRISAEESALAHYLSHRHLQTFSPLPFFDVAHYMQAYGDEIRAGRDPFAHYLATGVARELRPAREACSVSGLVQ